MKYLMCLLFLATSVVGNFQNDFYRLLVKEHAKENLISSPLALEIVLSMIYMGAKNKTADELREVLKASENKKDITDKYKAFYNVLKTREKNDALHIANSIYVNNKLQIVEEFKKLAAGSFNSQAVGISLEKADKAASIVNAWIKGKTNSKIPSIVTPQDLDASLKILVLNAFAFKGNWLFKFHAFKSKREIFTPLAGDPRPIPMMSQYGFYKADEIPELDAKVLQLHYHKSRLSMYIFLPNKPAGLSELEDRLDDYAFQNLTNRQVHIKLPKFKIDFTTVLDDILKKMGIVEAFGDAANLQDLVQGTGTNGISKVIQRGFVEINEEGSGFVSITGIRDSFVSSGPIPRTMDFRANHPFAFVIRDDKSTYFQGHFVSPEGM